MKYRPEIDGLRAIAVLAVVLFHLDFKSFSGGFVGVDVFFVISGFLITSIIYKELQKDAFTFAKFYERRIRRIVPALYLVLFVCTCFTFRFFMVSEMENYCQSLISSLLFYSNILFWHQSGYFDLDSLMKPLLHTWSLAIEEQFYILFPSLLIFLYAKFPKKIVHILSLIFLVSLGLSIHGAENRSTLAFYFVHTRAWELLLGSLIAVGAFPKLNGKVFHEVLCAVGLGMIGYGIFVLDGKSTFPGINAAIPCFGTALLIYSTIHDHAKTWVGKMLSTPPFVGIGKISYSFYLWHWPAIVFFKYAYVDAITLRHRIYILIGTFALSCLSWKFVEEPFRNKKEKFKNTRKLITGVGVATVALVLFGVYGIYLNKGIPQRLSPRVLQYASASEDINVERKECHEKSLVRAQHSDLCVLGNKKNEKPAFVVWGDSHGDALMPAFQLMAKKYDVFGQDLSHSACTPLLGVVRIYQGKKRECEKFNEAMIDYIEKNKIQTVMLVSRWTTTGVAVEGDEDNNSDKNIEIFKVGFENLLKRLQANGTKIWLVKKIPISRVDIPSALGRYTMFGKPTENLEIKLDAYQKYSDPFNAVIDSLKEKYDIHTLDLSEKLCSQESKRCMIEQDGHALYRDHHHLSTFGAEYLSPLLQPFFENLKRNRK